MITHPLSGRQDSNLRPPGPKPGAMTGLRYAPISALIKSARIFTRIRGAKVSILSAFARNLK